MLVLLIHLIKQHAEQRTTKSWNRSVDNALGGITKSNKRRSAEGHYLRAEEFKGSISETFPLAVRNAAYEAFEGIYSAEQLSTMIDANQIEQEAFNQILTYKLE